MTARRIRSTTDEELAARHDKMPYVTEFGDRSSLPREVIRGFVRANYLSPRVECIPSRDSRPWTLVDEWAGFILERHASEEAVELAIGRTPDYMLVDPERSRLTARFDPRPEFARPETNTVLGELRRAPIDDRVYWVKHYLDALGADVSAPELVREVVRRASTEDREDARLILSRWMGAFG